MLRSCICLIQAGVLSLSVLVASCLSGPGWSQTKDDRVRVNVTPEVVEDRVTLRVKVTENNKLQPNLRRQNFSVYVDCVREADASQCAPVELEDWRNPKESSPSPARIVLLLDLSGSMKEPDVGGQPKLQGAIDAIREFTKVLAERGANTEMVIVPFSDKAEYSQCQDDRVTDESLNRFAPASAKQHQEDLDRLQADLDRELQYRRQELTRLPNTASRICGETNLYESLATTVSFLGNLYRKNQYAADSSQTTPKLHVVLLSDGFNTVPFAQSSNICDRRHFDKLETEFLQKYRGAVTVHTLGYGRTPAELGKDNDYRQFIGGKRAECQDIDKFPTQELREKFSSELVDRDHLEKIATFTGGMHEFSGNAEDVAQRFREILNTILGEYQMTYTQKKDADTASLHTVRVVVTSAGRPEESDLVGYSMPFVFRVPFPIRFWLILLFFIVPLGCGILLLYFLAEDIKNQAQ